MTSKFRPVEVFCESRTGNPDTCEDAYVLRDDFAAVIDGCTDKAGVPYFAMSSGRFAAQVLAAGIERLPADIAFPDAVVALSQHLDSAIQRALPLGTVLADRPSAGVVIYSAERREIWRLGDCHFAVGDQVYFGDKAIDEVTSHVRAAYLQVLTAAGYSTDVLASDDPGRALILPLLREQHQLRNAEGSRYAYGSFDGLTVPARFVEVYPVPPEVTSIVLATDGYLLPAPTLREAEEHLVASLRDDPLRVGEFPSTKGVKPGARSFDDRTYLRLELEPISDPASTR
jgi:hypothetical protein